MRQLEEAREELAAQRKLREERERRAEELRGVAEELTRMRAALKVGGRVHDGTHTSLHIYGS